MKFGFRKPSLKSSISARTTGKFKRAVKRALIPGYGKKDMGWLHDPKKAMYNAVYRRTTFGLSDVVGALFKPKSRHSTRRTSSGGGGSYAGAYGGSGGGGYTGGGVSGTPVSGSGGDSSSYIGCVYMFMALIVFVIIALLVF